MSYDNSWIKDDNPLSSRLVSQLHTPPGPSGGSRGNKGGKQSSSNKFGINNANEFQIGGGNMFSSSVMSSTMRQTGTSRTQLDATRTSMSFQTNNDNITSSSHSNNNISNNNSRSNHSSPSVPYSDAGFKSPAAASTPGHAPGKKIQPGVSLQQSISKTTSTMDQPYKTGNGYSLEPLPGLKNNQAHAQDDSWKHKKSPHEINNKYQNQNNKSTKNVNDKPKQQQRKSNRRVNSAEKNVNSKNSNNLYSWQKELSQEVIEILSDDDDGGEEDHDESFSHDQQDFFKSLNSYTKSENVTQKFGYFTQANCYAVFFGKWKVEVSSSLNNKRPFKLTIKKMTHRLEFEIPCDHDHWVQDGLNVPGLSTTSLTFDNMDKIWYSMGTNDEIYLILQLKVDYNLQLQVMNRKVTIGEDGDVDPTLVKNDSSNGNKFIIAVLANDVDFAKFLTQMKCLDGLQVIQLESDSPADSNNGGSTGEDYLAAVKLNNYVYNRQKDRNKLKRRSVEKTGKVCFVYPVYENMMDVLTIYEGDLSRLNDGEFLNDSLIDICMKKLVFKQYFKENPPIDGTDGAPVVDPFAHNLSSIFAFSCLFYPKLTETTRRDQAYQLVSKWTKKVDLFTKELILIPINIGAHWSLVCIVRPGLVESQPYQNFRKGEGGNPDTNYPCVLFLDSLSLHSGPKVVDNILRYLEEEWKARKGSEVSFNRQTVAYINCNKNLPRQMNSYDCGMYVIKYAEQICQKFPFTSRQQDIDSTFMTIFQKNMFGEEEVTEGRKQLLEECLQRRIEWENIVAERKKKTESIPPEEEDAPSTSAGDQQQMPTTDAGKAGDDEVKEDGHLTAPAVVEKASGAEKEALDELAALDRESKRFRITSSWESIFSSQN